MMRKGVIISNIILVAFFLQSILFGCNDCNSNFSDYTEPSGFAPADELLPDTLPKASDEVASVVQEKIVLEYITIPELSFYAEFPLYGRSRFVVAYSNNDMLHCFIVDSSDSSDVKYKFPTSYLNSVHWPKNPNIEHDSVHYVDVNGDGQRDIVIITSEPTGNFHYTPSFATVFLGDGASFVPDDKISEELLAESEFCNGSQYITIEQICERYRSNE